MPPVFFNPTGKKVIVSIDGGGMRGILPLAVLAELEDRIGQPAYAWIDFVVGTSTGAVIAAGLALGYSAGELLRDVYRGRLAAAFPRRDWRLWRRFITGGLRHLYPIAPFQAALLPLGRGRRIGELTRPILLVTAKDVRTGTLLYFVSAGPGRAAFADVPVSGAVAASAAAPIYFPPVGGNLTDGGVGVDNNPCLIAAVEALEFLGPAAGFVPGQVMLISLGVGSVPKRHANGAADRFTVIDWIRYLIDETFDDASLQQALSTRAIYGSQLDFRRYNPELTPISLSERLGVPMVGRPDPRQIGLDTTEPTALALLEDIGRTYARAIDWLRPDVMPWDTPGGHAKPNPRAAAIDWSQTPYR